MIYKYTLYIKGYYFVPLRLPAVGKGGQKLRLQNTPPRQAKPATPQEGNF
jgi:hypothetical protein